jgi:hypothetical protein
MVPLQLSHYVPLPELTLPRTFSWSQVILKLSALSGICLRAL